MINLDNKIAIVYLSYIPFGVQYLHNYLQTYKNFDAGVNHDLIILFNGFLKEDEVLPFIDELNSQQVKYKSLNCPELFDIGSYFYAASKLNVEYIVFMNTYSKILCANWLLNLSQAIVKEGIGIVGCTGSWGNFIASKQINNSEINTIRKRIGVFIHKLNFKETSFHHIRTNSFIINRKIFLSLKYNSLRPSLLYKIKHKWKETKLKTLFFEHGVNNMTIQIEKMGFQAQIIDKFGKVYNVKDWRDSNVFWYGNQENLLIHDNQTLKYQNENEKQRAVRRYIAWKEK